MNCPVQTMFREQQRSLRIESPIHHLAIKDNCVDATGLLCRSIHYMYTMSEPPVKQGGRRRIAPQSSCHSYSQNTKSGNCSSVLDYDNPEKLFPYAGMPDLTRTCLLETGSTTDVYDFCPIEHYSSTKPRNSKVEPRFNYGLVRQKILTASLAVVPFPMRAQFRYCGFNRFQRVKSQKLRTTHDSCIILSPDTIIEAVCRLLLLSSLSLAFIKALFWAMSPPLGPIDTKSGRTLAMSNLFWKKTVQTISSRCIKESTSLSDLSCNGFGKSIGLGLVNDTSFFCTTRKPMSVITSQVGQDTVSHSSPGLLKNLDLPASITIVEKGRSMTLKCCIKQINSIRELRTLNGSAEGLEKIIRIRSLIPKPNTSKDMSGQNYKTIAGDEIFINFPVGVQNPIPQLCLRSGCSSLCDRMAFERETQNLPKQRIVQRLSEFFFRNRAKHMSKLAPDLEKTEVGLPHEDILDSQEMKDYYRKVSVLDVLRDVICKSSFAADNLNDHGCSEDLILVKTFIKKKSIRAFAKECRTKKPFCQRKCSHSRGIEFSSKQASKSYGEESNFSPPCVSCDCTNPVGAYIPRLREYEKRLKVFKKRSLKKSEVLSLVDGPPVKIARTASQSCEKLFVTKTEEHKFKQSRGQDFDSTRSTTDTMIRGAVGSHDEASRGGKPSLCAKQPSIRCSPHMSEKLNKTKRITTLISQFPTSSFALNSANSVLEIAVTEKFSPLSISCLDDPVTALNFVSNAREFVSNEHSYERRERNPHPAYFSKPNSSFFKMVTENAKLCSEQSSQELDCSNVKSAFLSQDERAYTLAKNSLRSSNMFRENANLPLISFSQADKKLVDSSIPTVPPRDMIHDRSCNDGSPLAEFFSARSHPQTSSPITLSRLAMIKDSTEVNSDRHCQSSESHSQIETMQAGKRLSHVSPGPFDAAGELLPVPPKFCVGEAGFSREHPKSILMQPDVDRKGNYTFSRNVHFNTSFLGIADDSPREPLKVKGIFEQNFVSKLRTTVEEESKHKNYVREKIDRLFATGWNDSLARDRRALTAHNETGNSTREKTNNARRSLRTNSCPNKIQIVTLGRSGELMSRYFQYKNGMFEPVEEESLWSWEYV